MWFFRVHENEVLSMSCVFFEICTSWFRCAVSASWMDCYLKIDMVDLERSNPLTFGLFCAFYRHLTLFCLNWSMYSYSDDIRQRVLGIYMQNIYAFLNCHNYMVNFVYVHDKYSKYGRHFDKQICQKFWQWRIFLHSQCNFVFIVVGIFQVTGFYIHFCFSWKG